MTVNPELSLLPARVRVKLSEAMDAEEKALWSGAQVPSHAWTMVGTTYPHGFVARAISLVVYEICAWTIAAVGLLLFAVFVDLLLGFPWTIPEFIGMVLVAPFSILVLGSGLQIAYMPILIMRVARDTYFVVTSKKAYIFDASGSEVEEKSFDLAYIMPTAVYRLSKSGIGDVIFDASTAQLVGGDSDTTTAFYDKGFFAVSGAVRVARLIDDVRLKRQNDA